MWAPRACASCSLNPANQPEREEQAPSELCAYLFELENALNLGMPLGGFKLTRMDRRGLAVVKYERQQAEVKRIKDKQR